MKNFQKAVSYSVKDFKRIAVTASASAVIFSLMILLSFPQYSYQMLSANPLLIFEAVSALSWNLIASSGILSLILTIIYSVIGGVASTILFYSVSIKSAGSLTPGLLVSGCASCGTGLLGLVGLGGALAALPFQGNLIRLGGIALIVFFLNRSGNPEICEVPEN